MFYSDRNVSYPNLIIPHVYMHCTPQIDTVKIIFLKCLILNLLLLSVAVMFHFTICSCTIGDLI